MMKSIKRTLCVFTAVILLTLTGCRGQYESVDSSDSAVLVPSMMAVNAVVQNPYIASGDSSVHNDPYSSDVTDAVMPLGFDSELSTSLETANIQAPPAAFYDEDGNAITPFLGGVAIAQMNGDIIERSGVFVPSQHDSEQYSVQISYSFVDSENNIVLPTSNGHVIVLRTKDAEGNILSVFEKVLDIDVISAAKDKLGEDIDTNLLSIVYDYSGNLWFVTGGFRIYPDRNSAGVMGYISREFIDKIMAGEAPESEGVFVYKLNEGEGAENGISANPDGAVIMTNMACYMLNADNGVNIKWRTEYSSNGTNDAEHASKYTGGGLAYGSGTTPTLTNDLVLFTDNCDPINLLALSSDTGEVVAQIPVLDTLGEDVPVSVENSILVYSPDETTTSVLVCNWFGAGNAGLSDPDANSSVQSYDNLYDRNWIEQGGEYLAPGVERVDIILKDGEYIAEKVWTRDDISDTSMIKLSTATGYLYGYWQNLETDMWCFEVLDFATGETALEVPVSSQPEYNNMAVGMIADVKGNTLYCPTNNMEMVIWQDSFVYLPQIPAKAVNCDDMERYRIDDEDFKEKTSTEYRPATFMMYATVDNLRSNTEIAFKVNGLNQKAGDYKLFFDDGENFSEFVGDWQLCNSDGTPLGEDAQLNTNEIYEIRFIIGDNLEFDLDSSDFNVKVSAILAV